MQQTPADLEHRVVPIDELEPHPRNPREGDVGAIVESLQAHGQYRPLVVNRRNMRVVAGNHTLAAARALGWTEVAVTLGGPWDDDQEARIVAVDNRTNDLATYDDHALTELLQELSATSSGLAGTGFDHDALDELVRDLTQPLHADWMAEFEQERGIGQHGRTNISFALAPADARVLEEALAATGQSRHAAVVTLARHYLNR